MVEQRRSQRNHHRLGGNRRAAGVATMAGLILVLGCSAQSRDPVGVGGPGEPGGIPSGPGGPNGGGVPSMLVGEWRNRLIIEMVGDFQTVTTTWRFRADRSCQQVVESFSALEGFSRTTTRDCSFVVGNFFLDVTFTDRPGSTRFDFSFTDFGATRLVLAGVEFGRVTGE